VNGVTERDEEAALLWFEQLYAALDRPLAPTRDLTNAALPGQPFGFITSQLIATSQHRVELLGPS
jgi:hypothetical protein